MRRAIVHPVLFALFPLLSLYAANLALFPVADLYRPAAIVLGATLLLWLILGLIVRSAVRSAMAVSTALLLFFAFGYVYQAMLKSDSIPFEWYSPKEKFQTEWLVFLGVVSLIPLWKWRFAAKLNSAYTVVGVALVVMPMFTILNGWWTSYRNATTLKANASEMVSQAAPLGKPDIFYVILDGYGRQDALQQFLGYDNSSFVAQLRQRGFYVADRSHSNYCQTELSLASSLNMGFLQNLVDKSIQESQDRSITDYMIDRSAVARYLKDRGYQYVAITSGAPNIPIKSADLHVQDEAKISLYESTLMENTPLGAPKKRMSNYLYDNRRDHLVNALDLLGRSGAPTSKPRFVFVHILAPHPPFVIGPGGEPFTPAHPFSFEDGTAFYTNGGTPQEYQDGYLKQLQYVNQRMIQDVDAILRQERTPPIILIQGDHGSKKGWAPEDLATTNVKEVFRNLSAFYVPQPIAKQLYPEITPVNSFRLIFNTLFSDHMQPLPDQSFFSPISKPFAFTYIPSAKIEDGAAKVAAK